MERNIEVDYTVIAKLPDGVELDDCEVIVHKASVSYRKPGNCETITMRYDDETHASDVGLEVIGKRIVNADTGEELESE